MRHYFLGLAANYSRKERIRHTFCVGFEKDRRKLKNYLREKYEGEAVLTKNGRSALAMALKAYFKPGDAVLVNGFTCFAVYEAIKAARLTPVFVDIDRKDLNASLANFRSAPVVADDLKSAKPRIKGLIIQNTFGNPVNMKGIEKFARENNLIIIEDLAHSVGIKYPDGREAGMVGAATVFSFGKEKAIDTISGGAVVFRRPHNKSFEPGLRSKISDSLRARFYPLFGAIGQGLSCVHLTGCWINLLLKMHWIEKSADNKLDLDRKINKFEAKLALRQFKKLEKGNEGPLREFFLVNDRDEVLEKLKKAGYYFSGFWYEKPVSPERYYKKVNFPEEKCPEAVYVSQHIINFPNYYKKEDLEPARKIVMKYLEEEK